MRRRIGLKKKTYGSTNQIVHHVTSQSKQWIARLDADVFFYAVFLFEVLMAR